MKSARLLLVVAFLVLAPKAAHAQLLFLSVSPQTVSFPSSDPDTVPVIVAPPIRVTYLILGNSGQWIITALASGDLTAGPAQIDISNITWTATPSPTFRNGTLSDTVAQVVASGTGNAFLGVGSVTFRFANSWNYSAGNYSQTVVFTLSAP